MGDLDVRDNYGQVAGNITNLYGAGACPGPHACPHDLGEEALQRKFEENTGISCGKGPRIALQHLLDVGHFDRRGLALAWRMKAILWDWDRARIQSNRSLLELAYGYSLMMLGCMMFVGSMVLLLLGRSQMPPWDLAMSLATALTLLVMATLAEKYLVRPNRIAARAKPVIEAYYENQ